MQSNGPLKKKKNTKNCVLECSWHHLEWNCLEIAPKLQFSIATIFAVSSDCNTREAVFLFLAFADIQENYKMPIENESILIGFSRNCSNYWKENDNKSPYCINCQSFQMLWDVS